MSDLKFLNPSQVRRIAADFGSPCYVYTEDGLRRSVEMVLNFPNAFGLTARYAIKANPNGAILRLFDHLGLHFDASSEYEVKRLLMNGIAPEKIQLTAQELAKDLKSLVEKGVLYNACSLRQLEAYGKNFPGTSVSIRINPGIGSGHANKTNVGGPSSSFGMTMDHVPQIRELADKYDLTITKFHSHIGSGSDPAVWEKATALNLEAVKAFPDVTTLNMGGGFKVARLETEKTTDLQLIGERVKNMFENFHFETGRELRLEIEPGTYLTAANGALLSTIDDKVSTGADGYTFLKLDTGMSDFLRPTLYGVQHSMVLVSRDGSASADKENVVIVGHACESGDILTPKQGDAEAIDTVDLPRAAIGDHIIIEDAGAYCSSMCAVNYNSFPVIPEVMLRCDGSLQLIRRRQPTEDLIADEINDLNL